MILILMVDGKIFMLTLFSLVAPQCIQVLLTECRKRSQLLHHQPSRSRSLLHLKENTLYGLVDPSWPLCPLSRLCGSLRKNMRNPVLELFTANASNLLTKRSIQGKGCGNAESFDLILFMFHVVYVQIL